MISAVTPVPLQTHPLYTVTPRYRSDITWYDGGRWILWALIGNEDDGMFGEDAHYRSDEPMNLIKAVRWTLRNPLHNFSYYIIGSADQPSPGLLLVQISSESVEFLQVQLHPTTVFAGAHSSLYLALHGGKPFLSCCWEWPSGHQTKFYIGWRNRGNFGIKVIFYTQTNVRSA